jgi:hypothetical protein
MFDEARLALGLIYRLTDAEQYVLRQWLLLGVRSPLSIAGVDSADFPEPLFEGDDPSGAEDTAYPDRPARLYSVLWFIFVRRLEIVPAIREWFTWHSRLPLFEAGLTDEDIGPFRIIADDIFAEDSGYGEAADGTLEYCTTDDGLPRARLKLGDREVVE